MLVPLAIEPGIYTEQTDRGAFNRWKYGDKVRFVKGLPTKIGGWHQQVAANLLGVCRALHDWQSLDEALWVAIGTHKKLYLWQDDDLFDITPIASSGQLTDPFDTVDTETIVTVAHTSHGRQVGDFVHYDNATAVGGITLDGEYEVLTTPTANTYTIEHSSAATSTANGGGTVDYEYEISIGTTGLSGFGVGPYGEEDYGDERSSVLAPRIRIWSLDNWGEDLIASPRDGAIYVWDKSAGTGTRATLIANAPSTNHRVIVSPTFRRIISFGADDPLQIKWCDSEDYNDWTATLTNTAGDARLDSGSELITAVRTRNEIVVFTDRALYSMQEILNDTVPPLVYRLAEKGEARIMGPNAAVDVNGVVYFMSLSSFMVYDGRIQTIPCDVRNEVFDNLNIEDPAARDAVYAGHNALFHEVTWFYADSGSTEPNRYVSYNYEDGNWSIGELSRSAWHDASAVFDKPYALSPDGRLFKHETGVDSVTLNGGGSEVTSAIRAYVESYDAEVGEGEQFMLLTRGIPDFKELVGEVRLTFTGKKYPAATATTSKGPFVVDSTTEHVDFRLRARQVSMLLESLAVGAHWRYGTMRFRARPYGRR